MGRFKMQTNPFIFHFLVFKKLKMYSIVYIYTLAVIFLVILWNEFAFCGFHSASCLASDQFIDEFEHSKDNYGLTFMFRAVDENSFNFQKSY